MAESVTPAHTETMKTSSQYEDSPPAYSSTHEKVINDQAAAYGYNQPQDPAAFNGGMNAHPPATIQDKASFEQPVYNYDQPSDPASFNSGITAYPAAPVPMGIIRTPVVSVPHVEDNLVFSVLATVFCCWIIGLFAIIKSLKVREDLKRGDIDSAVRSAQSAKRLAVMACIAGVVLIPLYIGLGILRAG